MLKNPHILQRLEDAESRASPPDFERNLELFEAMYQHARALGVWEQGPDTLPLKLRLAKALQDSSSAKRSNAHSPSTGEATDKESPSPLAGEGRVRAGEGAARARAR